MEERSCNTLSQYNECENAASCIWTGCEPKPCSSATLHFDCSTWCTSSLCVMDATFVSNATDDAKMLVGCAWVVDDQNPEGMCIDADSLCSRFDHDRHGCCSNNLLTNFVTYIDSRNDFIIDMQENALNTRKETRDCYLEVVQSISESLVYLDQLGPLIGESSVEELSNEDCPASCDAECLKLDYSNDTAREYWTEIKDSVNSCLNDKGIVNQVPQVYMEDSIQYLCSTDVSNKADGVIVYIYPFGDLDRDGTFDFGCSYMLGTNECIMGEGGLCLGDNIKGMDCRERTSQEDCEMYIHNIRCEWLGNSCEQIKDIKQNIHN